MLQILIRLVFLWFLWGLIRVVIRAFSGATTEGAGSWGRRAGEGSRGRAGGSNGAFGGHSGRRSGYRGPSARRMRKRREALEVLGLSEGASADDVKRSYRNLARKYHPDRVARKAPELSDIASEKFREVHDAYEYLMANGTGRATG